MAGLSVAQEPVAPADQQRLPAMRRGRGVPSGTPMSEDQPYVAPQPDQNGGQPGPGTILPVNPNGIPPGAPMSEGQPYVAPQSNQNGGQPGPASSPMPVQAIPATSPMPADLAPPTPPQVTYRDGQLTVNALNSTLISVLTAIRNKTGIQFEGLDAAPERIVVSMGPASEGAVLAAILSGSHFDYVAVDRGDSPGIVQRVILMPHSGGASPATVASSPQTTSPADSDEDAADEDADNLRTPPQDTPARPPVMQAQPVPPPQPIPLPPQPNPQVQGDNATKTPEQLLEELKALQQRQQQTQEQAAPQKVPH